jgi:hypothetical protein
MTSLINKEQFLIDNGWHNWKIDVPYYSNEKYWYNERYHQQCLNEGQFVESGYENVLTWFAIPLSRAVEVTSLWVAQDDLNRIINE